MDTEGPSDRASALTASSVMRSDFRTVRRGGFDTDEVAAHLGRVADHVADLEARILELEGKLEERDRAAPSEEEGRLGAYEDVAARVADLLRVFDDDVERLRGDAKSEAESLLHESRAEAERTRAEAEKLSSNAAAEAERVLRDAQQRADAIMTDLRSRRSTLLEDCRGIREGLVRTMSALDEVLSERPQETPSGDTRGPRR
jgi:DivIVA domain-containing protein